MVNLLLHREASCGAGSASATAVSVALECAKGVAGRTDGDHGQAAVVDLLGLDLELRVLVLREQAQRVEANLTRVVLLLDLLRRRRAQAVPAGGDADGLADADGQDDELPELRVGKGVVSRRTAVGRYQ